MDGPGLESCVMCKFRDGFVVHYSLETPGERRRSESSACVRACVRACVLACAVAWWRAFDEFEPMCFSPPARADRFRFVDLVQRAQLDLTTNV